MYLKVIRNRGQKNNLHLKKILVIFLVVLLAYIVFKFGFKEIKVVNMKNKVCAKIEEVIFSTYKFALIEKYSIKSYELAEDNQVNITDFVNYNSNLYTYMEEQKNIQVVYADPSYICSDNNSTKLTDSKINEELSTKSDNGEGENTNENVNTADKNIEVNDANGVDGYTPPKVADEGIRYTTAQLSDFNFLMSKLYVVPARAKVIEEELNAKEMLAKDMALKQDNSKPQILIYHTHSQEGFADSVKGKPETHIVGVGDYLAKLLSEEYGYNVIHCRDQFDIRDGKLDRSKAYAYAEERITQILQDNPSIEVVLDIHRDGLKEGAQKLVTTIDGKQVAKIMFFNGVSRSSTGGDIEYLYNRYKKDNLAFSFQLKLASMECFPEYTRKNYLDAYQYNQHLRGKSVLIEVGAQNNTLQEELNSMEVLAEILHRVIK